MNSKSKGSSFERDICKKLSIYLTNGKDERVMWRTSNSGGTATVQKNMKSKFAKKNAGDICQISERGLYKNVDKFFDTYFIECKAYKYVSIYPPLNKIWMDWIEECQRNKSITNKKIFLIVKFNNRKILVFSEDSYNDIIPKQLTLYVDDLILHCYMFSDIENNNKIF